MEFRLGSAAFILVVATYLFLGGMGVTDRGNLDAAEAAYNLQARGLLAGHLYAAKEAPKVLTDLANPYDPVANRVARDDPRYRLHDFSYYKGRMYLYFGVAPTLLVFIPWHLVTGGWLPHWTAVVMTCLAGILVNLALVRSVRQREFPGAGPWVTAVCVLILGLGSYGPLLAARADMWEVPIAMSYLAVSAALLALWKACTNPEKSGRWMAAASAAMGIAFASRPTAIVNCAILLFPLAIPEVRRRPGAWLGASVPLGLCGLGVALYNRFRFDHALDFGQHYQLASVYVEGLRTFSPAYFWTDIRFYLFQPVHWASPFPFAHEPPLAQIRAVIPPGHGGTEQISGALLYAPILWAAAAVPVAARSLADRAFTLLAACVAWVSLSSLVLLSFFFGACSRYQFEFVPALALLASFGVMAMEARLGGAALHTARLGWGIAVLATSAFGILYGIERCAIDHDRSGVTYMMEGQVDNALREFSISDSLSPGNALSRLGPCLMLETENRTSEALASLRSLVRDEPDFASGHFALGNLLARQGSYAAAASELSQAHRLDPDNPAIGTALERALSRAGKGH